MARLSVHGDTVANYVRHSTDSGEHCEVTYRLMSDDRAVSPRLAFYPYVGALLGAKPTAAERAISVAVPSCVPRRYSTLCRRIRRDVRLSRASALCYSCMGCPWNFMVVLLGNID